MTAEEVRLLCESDPALMKYAMNCFATLIAEAAKAAQGGNVVGAAGELGKLVAHFSWEWPHLIVRRQVEKAAAEAKVKSDDSER